MSEAVARSAGWSTVAFGDVVRQVKDKVDPEGSGLERYVAGEHMDTDDLRIRRWGEIGDGYLGPAFHMRFKPLHVLYGSRRTYLRKVAVADFEGITANTTYVLESKDPEVLLPGLLPFVMQAESFHAHSKRESKGSVNPYVNFSDLAWYEFALPPLEEQRRITEVLQAAERSKNVYKSTLLSLQKAAEALGRTRASSFAQIYPLVDLEEVADVRYGLTVNQARRKSDSHAPYLRVANVLRGSLDLSEVKDIGVLSGDDNFKLLHGDVLIVEGHADPTAIGRAAVWLDAIPGVMHQNHLIRARCSEALNHDFLCMLVNSPHGMVHFQSRAKSSSGLNTINSTVVKKYRIPLPPREVQDQIASEFSEIRDAAGTISARTEELKALSDQLLRSATGGQL